MLRQNSQNANDEKITQIRMKKSCTLSMDVNNSGINNSCILCGNSELFNPKIE